MKCPLQTITTERVIPGDGTQKETKVVFAECVGDECPFYEKVMYKKLDGSKPPRFQVFCNATRRMAK